MAKAINFGYAYGMWWKKFQMYALDNYDVVVTPKQAQASRVAYFDLYRKLPAYHTRQRNFAHRHGYVRSMFGRKRRLPRAMDTDDSYERGEAERQSINSPVQSFASDLNLAAAVELSERHSRSYFRIAGTVHDSILMYVRKDKLRMVVDDVLKTMSHPALLDEFEIHLSIPIEADVKIGPWSLGKSPEEYFHDKGHTS
jgi:DNA polymerase I-like protein with 3'-5' exonuclease and polymerase domains